MQLIHFLRKHLVPFGLVVGGILTGYGFVSDALELYQLGLPGWVWQLVGVFVVVASLLIFVRRNESRPATDSLEAPEPAAAPVLAEEKPELADGQRRHRLVMHEMMSTARSAGYALGSRDLERIRLEVPGMKSTLLTLSKAYDLRIPEFHRSARPRRCLEAGARYLTDVGALLRQGHVDEAREAAKELVPMLNAYLADERDVL